MVTITTDYMYDEGDGIDGESGTCTQNLPDNYNVDQMFDAWKKAMSFLGYHVFKYELVDTSEDEGLSKPKVEDVREVID